jgi:light-regulated signal transduction histidine kinase (bacteriophytochrome)
MATAMRRSLWLSHGIIIAIGVVTLILARRKAEADEWRIKDTGIGIKPEQIGTLFKDFTQAESSINRRFGGSDLGLSISKRLLDRHDWSLPRCCVNSMSNFKWQATAPRQLLRPSNSPSILS